MTHAYTEGLSATLHAIAALAGVLSILLPVALVGVILAGIVVDAYTWAELTLKAHRVRRSHARSGRLTGPQ